MCEWTDYLPDDPLGGDPLYRGRQFGGVASPLTMQRVPISGPPEPEDMIGPGIERTFNLRSPLHAPTDRVIPLPVGSALSKGLQVVDLCSPHTAPMQNYGYPRIGDSLKAPYEPVQYSYAALDNESLLNEVKERLRFTLYGHY